MDGYDPGAALHQSIPLRPEPPPRSRIEAADRTDVAPLRAHGAREAAA
jgi:hypothetical protein